MDYHSRLNSILAKPGNKTCADCNGRNPRWASISLGVFVCIRCCGLHRALGTHISKMKSTTLDKWSPQMFAIFEAIENDMANSYWEANMPKNYNKPVESTTAYSVEMFLRDKYERKLWIGSGPDPVSMALQPRAPVREVKKEEVRREEKRPVSSGPVITDLLADSPTVLSSNQPISFPQAIYHSHSVAHHHHHHSSSPPGISPSFPQAHVAHSPNPALFSAFQSPPVSNQFPQFESPASPQFPPVVNNQNQGFVVQNQNSGYQNNFGAGNYPNTGSQLSQSYGPGQYANVNPAPNVAYNQPNPPINYSQVEAEKNKKINQVLSMYGPQSTPAPSNNNTGFKPLGAIAAQNFFNQNSRSQPYPTF